MGHRHFQELRLENFRCFRDPQTARLAPLTLLVGENSTGKTSFLAAIRAICDVALLGKEPNFRETPYDLGTFPEIVHRSNVRDRIPDAFQIGIEATTEPHFFGCSAVFKSGSGVAPVVTSGRVTNGRVWIEWRNTANDKVEFTFGSGDESWGRAGLETTPGDWQSVAECSLTMMKENSGDRKWHGGDLASMHDLIAAGSLSVNPPFASAPLRASPRRTYDPRLPSPDPQGSYIPTFLSSMQLRNTEQWSELKRNMEKYGRTSGLFDELLVNQFGAYEGAPFQLQVRKFGKRRKGLKRNLIDVGYGVSQAIPMLVELFRPDGTSVFLIQQPEVHLHPLAQAEIGSLFCRAAASGRQFIIETHSDYIVDRVRMDVRDRKTELTPADVSLLYFERSDLDVHVHSLRFDEQGNVLDAPHGYGRFFMNETRRSVGL